MPTRYYRLTVIACAFSWFMLGLHVPVLHGLTHGHVAPWSALVATALLAVVALAGLWALLRNPSARRGASGSGPSAA